MKLTDAERRYLTACAESAARAAGEWIATTRPATIEHKPGALGLAAQVVTEIDRRSEAMILEHLAPTLRRFDLGLLTEERADDGSRLIKDHFWCIDPLDGTLPFIEGSAGFAVSIALVSRAGTPALGVVFDPSERRLYAATRGLGLRLDGQPWSPPATDAAGPLRVFMDRSFLAAPDHAQTMTALNELARECGLGAARLETGAGGVMNACRVLGSPPACYFKFPRAAAGGGRLWDFAATACLFGEAGAIATDLHGGALELNRADATHLGHRGVLFATDARLAARLRALPLPEESRR